MWHSALTENDPAANGLVERFHRTLKAAIMCHADQHWTEALPMVILEIVAAFKADLQVSVAELVYGKPLRIPSEVLTPTADPVEPSPHQPVLGTPQISSFSTPRLTGYIRAKPPPQVYAGFPSAEHTRRALQPPLQRPLPGPFMEEGNSATPGARQARHRIN
jgi:hypothetical protein